MTIGAIVESFSSITLCTITLYFKPHLVREAISVLIIYYGYLIVNLLIVTLILTFILILVAYPFMG